MKTGTGRLHKHLKQDPSETHMDFFIGRLVQPKLEQSESNQLIFVFLDLSTAFDIID